jgi:hypothetical protein
MHACIIQKRVTIHDIYILYIDKMHSVVFTYRGRASGKNYILKCVNVALFVVRKSLLRTAWSCVCILPLYSLSHTHT